MNTQTHRRFVDLPDMVRVGWDCPACGAHHSTLEPRHTIGRVATFAECPSRRDAADRAIITIHTEDLQLCTECTEVITDDDMHSTPTGWCHGSCCRGCPAEEAA